MWHFTKAMSNWRIYISTFNLHAKFLFCFFTWAYDWYECKELWKLEHVGFEKLSWCVHLDVECMHASCSPEVFILIQKSALLKPIDSSLFRKDELFFWPFYWFFVRLLHKLRIWGTPLLKPSLILWLRWFYFIVHFNLFSLLYNILWRVYSL